MQCHTLSRSSSDCSDTSGTPRTPESSSSLSSSDDTHNGALKPSAVPETGSFAGNNTITAPASSGVSPLPGISCRRRHQSVWARRPGLGSSREISVASFLVNPNRIAQSAIRRASRRPIRAWQFCTHQQSWPQPKPLLPWMHGCPPTAAAHPPSCRTQCLGLRIAMRPP
jgi:hypothetical protein